MSKKNKGKTVTQADLAKEAANPTPPTSQDTGTQSNPPPPPPEEGKTFLELKKAYDQDANKALRMTSNYGYVKRLLNLPQMTWEEFCNVKIKAFTDYWTGKKTKPKGTRAPKVLSPEDFDKKMKELASIETRAANLRASIELTKRQSGAAVAPVPEPVGSVEGDIEEDTEG